MSISLSKIEQEAPALLSLAKQANEALSLRKLDAQRSKVALVLDYSGSMSGQYRSGAMQRLAERILALGTQMDDDGSIELFLFDSGASYAGDISVTDYQGSIDRLTRGRRMGTTNYAAAFDEVVKYYGFSPAKTGGLGGLFRKSADTFAPLSSPANEPVFAVFLTDGSPDNKTAAVQAITRASYAPIFWQFLSIGSESMPFLEKLDDLDGRYIDNADYKPVGDVDRLSDTQLYNLLLDEYPGWVAEERRRGQIR